MTAEELQTLRTEMRIVAREVLSEGALTMPPVEPDILEESQTSFPFVFPKFEDTTNYELSAPYPFEIVVEFNETTSVPTVYVRNGAFVMNEPDGTHKFVATNDLDNEAAYTLYEVPNTIAANKTIWAKLVMSDTDPVASIVTTKPTDDMDVFYVCIGKVNAYGGIEQYVFGHIPLGGQQIPDTDIPGLRKSIEKCPAEDEGKGAWQMRNFHLTATKEDQVPHVSFPSAGKRDIAWRWPVKGPDATTDDPGSLSSQVVTEIVNGVGTSGNAVANIGVKSRVHTVGDGDEAWGADPESGTNVQVGVTWTGGTLYQVWQVTSGGYGWDWTRAHA